MAARKPTQAQSIYQLKITLKDCRPPIWRRVQVRSNSTLADLHWVIQRSMGWENSHLHSFTIRGVEYGVPMPEFGFDEGELRDEQPVKLSKVISGETFKFFYLYDFGDSWEHEVLVEKVLQADPEISYPICLKARRACPPEDCGGVWGYESFLGAIQDPAHPEHDEMLEWIGGSFDPEAVNLEEINFSLKEIPKD
jgi:hypothetical protein